MLRALRELCIVGAMACVALVVIALSLARGNMVVKPLPTFDGIVQQSAPQALQCGDVPVFFVEMRTYYPDGRFYRFYMAYERVFAWMVANPGKDTIEFWVDLTGDYKPDQYFVSLEAIIARYPSVCDAVKLLRRQGV